MSELSKQSSNENSKADKQPKVDKVTSVNKTGGQQVGERTKDPRKVELGKKLAKISKEAKERKARQQSQRIEEETRRATESIERKVDRDDRSLADFSSYVDFRYIVGGVTIVAALGGLFYAYKNDKRFERSSESKRSDPKGSGADERSELPDVSPLRGSTTQTASSSCIENL